MKNDIYTDIATRTGGDIYIGVVGPVRTGKSTFIKQFMEQSLYRTLKATTARSVPLTNCPSPPQARLS